MISNILKKDYRAKKFILYISLWTKLIFVCPKALDAGVGAVFDALKEADMYNNSGKKRAISIHTTVYMSQGLSSFTG